MIHKFQCNTILFYGDFLLVNRTDDSQNLIVIPLIYEFVYIIRLKLMGIATLNFKLIRDF